MVVGRADEEIVERKNLVRRAIQTLLPHHGTGHVRQRHHAAVVQRDIHPFACQGRSDVDTAAHAPTPDRLPGLGSKREQDLRIECGDQPAVIPDQRSRQRRLDRNRPAGLAGRGLEPLQLVAACDIEQRSPDRQLADHGVRVHDLPDHVTVSHVHRRDVAVAQRDKDVPRVVDRRRGRGGRQHGGGGPERLHREQHRGCLSPGADAPEQGHARHKGDDAVSTWTSHLETTRYCGAPRTLHRYTTGD